MLASDDQMVSTNISKCLSTMPMYTILTACQGTSDTDLQLVSMLQPVELLLHHAEEHCDLVSHELDIQASGFAAARCFRRGF